MANIRINIDHATKDGLELVFRAPCDASEITGLTVHSITADTTQEFKLTDANGNDLGSINHLFAGSAVVKVILDVTQGKAFVQNADTNKYIEDRFLDLENKDGKDGKDGVSCTHSWDGTVLNVTSASGTSSADLKGEKGDVGESGITSPVAGFFTLSVDAEGDLWVYSEDDNVPEFEYDSETGYLYVVQEVDV